jgi:hypothetical protein
LSQRRLERRHETPHRCHRKQAGPRTAALPQQYDAMDEPAYNILVAPERCSNPHLSAAWGQEAPLEALTPALRPSVKCKFVYCAITSCQAAGLLQWQRGVTRCLGPQGPRQALWPMGAHHQLPGDPLDVCTIHAAPSMLVPLHTGVLQHCTRTTSCCVLDDLLAPCRRRPCKLRIHCNLESLGTVNS